MNFDEEHDDLWELLGRAQQPTPSPFFSRNVLREVRGLQQERRAPWLSWILRWQPVAVAVAIAALAGSGWAVRHQQQKEQQQLLTFAKKVYTSPDYAVINDLDDLIDTEKNSVWLSAETN